MYAVAAALRCVAALPAGFHDMFFKIAVADNGPLSGTCSISTIRSGAHSGKDVAPTSNHFSNSKFKARFPAGEHRAW